MSQQVRRTAEQWRELIEQQAQSDLTVEAFCRRRGVAVSTFFARRRKLADRAGPAFVEVTASTEPPALPVADSPLELILPGGMMIRVPVGFDAVTLRRLMEALS